MTLNSGRFASLFAVPLRNGLTRPKAARGHGVKMVNMGEIFAYDRIGDISMERVLINDRERESFVLQEGDLLFARQSLVLAGAGKCCIILRVHEPTTFESHIIRARLNRKLAEPLYYYYFFNSMLGRQAIESIVEQVAAAGIRGSDLARLNIPVPSLPEQRSIAQILDSLDTKIELNRKISETLEAMVRTLFKSWFIDFDPLRANAENCGTCLPKHLSELFPNTFEDSNMGPIPAGWKIGTLGDVTQHPRRGVKVPDLNESTPYIALEHMPQRSIALSKWDTAAGLTSGKFAFKQGEILFGKLRPYFHKVGVAPVDGVCSTDIVVIAPKAEEWFGFMLGHVSSEGFVNYTTAGSTGTKMPRTSWTEMSRYSVVLPPSQVAAAFNELISAYVSRITVSIHECRTLASLRDALLPKLVSGELRVRDIGKVATACV
jgi:type I restriction enzyme S subunit